MSNEPSSSSDKLAIQVPFFRPKKALTTLRKREDANNIEYNKNNEDMNQKPPSEESDLSSDSDDQTEKVHLKLLEKRRRLRGRNLIQTTSKKRRKEIDELAESSGEEEDEPVKFDPDVKFASSGVERVGPKDMGATARTEVDTEYGRDAQSQFERVQAILKKEREEMERNMAKDEEERKKYGERAKKAKDGMEASTSKEPKVYKGMAMYGAKEKEDTIKGNATSGMNRLGPIRATQYMRASVRWDYAPDICKDYKETGFCTFGDSCKFMHDRTDYKHGWEIERDWTQGKLKESKEDEYLISSEGDSDDDEKLPHSCHICREHFNQPVVTKCKHYFCESCALKNYQKSKKCAVCGEKTDGIFNVARDILAKMKARDKANAAKQTKENDEEEGEEEVEQMEIKTLPMADEADTEECSEGSE